MKKLPPKKPTKGMICVIYARYSSTAQNDTSIEQQVERCTAFAKKLGLTIIFIFDDRAVSGRDDKRPAFQKMLKEAETGAFQYVIAWKSNRMGRNMLQAMVNEQRLNELGVRVLYVEEDFEDNAAGRFALRNMMNVNQFYSENLAEDCKRGMEANAKECKVNGMLPYGYKASADMHYEIDESKAPIVREAFSAVAGGKLMSEVIDDLNSRGIKTAQGKTWGHSSIRNMLENERYTGVYIFKDVRIENGIPPIVSRETYEKAQEALKMTKKTGKRRNKDGIYLLTGKLFCGLCLAPMVGTSGTSRNGTKHFYYVCQNRKAKTCEKEAIRREYIEELVAEAIKETCLTDDVINLIADKAVEIFEETKKNSDVNILKDELKTVESSVKNVMRAIECGIITKTTKNRLIELETQQNELIRAIKQEEASFVDVTKEELVAAMSLYKTGDVKDKKYQATLIDTFVKAVYLHDDRLRITFTSFDGKGDKHVEVECSDREQTGVPVVLIRTERVKLILINNILALEVSFK